jgi:hypothetical protein
MAYDLTPGGTAPQRRELRSMDRGDILGYTGIYWDILGIILRPFLPTVHFNGGGARLVLSGLNWNVREIHVLLHIVLVFESAFDS